MVEIVAVGAAPVASAPVNPSERIDAIDVLRGIALFGVLAINVVNEFRVSFFEEFLPVANTTGTLDRAVQTFLTMAIELKAMALFSLLFGIGMAIQFERLTPNPRRCMLLMRRLAILLVIGVAHLFLIWNGDILTEYSLAGFIALPFLWGPRWPLAARASLFLAVYLVMPRLPPVVPRPTTAWSCPHWLRERVTGDDDGGLCGAAVAHGFYELPGAIHRLRVGFLRLWSRPVRPRWRRHSTRDRCLRVCRASDDQRPMAAVLSVRPHRVAVAQLDVRHSAALAHPPSRPFRRVRVADDRGGLARQHF